MPCQITTGIAPLVAVKQQPRIEAKIKAKHWKCRSIFLLRTIGDGVPADKKSAWPATNTCPQGLLGPVSQMRGRGEWGTVLYGRGRAWRHPSMLLALARFFFLSRKSKWKDKININKWLNSETFGCRKQYFNPGWVRRHGQKPNCEYRARKRETARSLIWNLYSKPLTE